MMSGMKSYVKAAKQFILISLTSQIHVKHIKINFPKTYLTHCSQCYAYMNLYQRLCIKAFARLL